MASNSRALLLHSITLIALFICYAPIANSDNDYKEKFVCATSRTQLDKMGREEIGNNARIKYPDRYTDKPIIEFDGDIPGKGRVLGLITCERSQQFIVSANYLPEEFEEERGEEVTAKMKDEPDKTVEVPSCRNIFEKSVNTDGCEVGEEKSECKEREETGLLNCTTKFNLDCDLTKYTAEVNEHPMIFLLDGNFNVTGSTPCHFKFEAPKDFRLLFRYNQDHDMNAFKTLDECLKSMDKDVEKCGQTTMETMSMDNGNGTETEEQTNPPSTNKPKKPISHCILKLPFIILIGVALLNLLIIIVLVILAVCKRCKADVNMNGPKYGARIPGSKEQKKVKKMKSTGSDGEDDNEIDDQRLVNDSSWRIEKSEWLGNHEPNIKDDQTAFDNASTDAIYDVVTDQSGYNDGAGIDVPPTREEDFDDDDEE